MRIAWRASATTTCLCILDSRGDEVESVVGGPPAVSVVSQSHEVRPGDDEPVTAHAQRLRVTRNVGLQREELDDINTLSMIILTRQGPATWAPS